MTQDPVALRMTAPHSCPDVLPEIPGGWTTRDFLLAGTSLRVTLPASPDAFLDDPRVLAANRRDDYMPYWSYLWPTSLETAVAVLQQDWAPETEALEIGAGIALTGQAALKRGLKVSFSDYDPQAIDLALYNARENGTLDRAEGLLLDWRQPIDRRYPVIFGCDVIYERPNHRPILGLLEKMLAPAGVAWITDPGRHQADAFLALLADSPFRTEHRTLVREPYPGRPAGVTNLWSLRWKTGP
ncbi:MAG: methyltransferase [Planctomycetes bacterium]|nr:methyltransferase [Planctomycetota bacterium]